MQYFIRFETKLGPMWISEDDNAITHMKFGSPLPLADAREQETPLLKEAKRQLLDYLGGLRTAFELPINPPGTEFQHMAWQALRDIPYGETRTYAQVAQAIGRPKAARAVGLANNQNPLHILTPCHRVIGANGDLVGFAAGLDVKKALLDLEAAHR